MRYLMTFASTAHAMKAESVLLKKEVPLKIRPLPNEISSGCGISIVFDDLEVIKELVSENKFVYEHLYEHNQQEYKELD